MANRDQSAVKKVKAYPFEAAVESHGQKFVVQVRRITQQGLIADVGTHLLVAGEDVKISLELPTMGKWVISTAKVMKTYDQFVTQTGPAGHVERMAEFQFLALSQEHRANIQIFMAAIKQA